MPVSVDDCQRAQETCLAQLLAQHGPHRILVHPPGRAQWQQAGSRQLQVLIDNLETARGLFFDHLRERFGKPLAGLKRLRSQVGNCQPEQTS